MKNLAQIVIVLILLSACSSGSAGPTATPQPGAADPVAAVKGFFNDVYSGQDASALICSTPGVADAFRVAAAASAALPGASIDISGLTFTVKNQTADSATVTVAGQIITSVLDSKSSADFPTSDVSVTKEGGTWKFCGVAN